MYCPKCGHEYNKGITICPECGVGLVEERPGRDDSDSDDREFESIVATHNSGDISLIKSLLDSADIYYYIEGDTANAGGSFSEPARVYVHPDQLEEARSLLEDVELTYTARPPRVVDIDDDDDESDEYDDDDRREILDDGAGEDSEELDIDSALESHRNYDDDDDDY